MTNIPGVTEALYGDGHIRPVFAAYGDSSVTQSGLPEGGLMDSISVDLIAPDSGLVLAGRSPIRPFGFEATQHEASMLAVDTRHHIVKVPLQEIVGLTLHGAVADENASEGFLPLASFAYRHGTGDGLALKDPIVALKGIGCCVYSGHLGQRPTWYFNGVRAGEFDPVTGQSTYLDSAERTERQPESFPAPVLLLIRFVELRDEPETPGRLLATL